MSFNAEGIAAIIVALAGLVSGLYNLMQARRVQALDQLDSARKELENAKSDQRQDERRLEIAMRHIHELNLVLARNGIDEVKAPEELG